MIKAQTSIEYILVLAIVLLTALIVAALLNSFIDFGSSGMEQQSRSYWNSATPFSIISIKISENNVQMYVKNQLSQPVNLTRITFDGDDLGIQSQIFAPSQAIVINGTTHIFTCVPNQGYKITKIIFNYNQGSVTGLTQTGDKSLIMKCS